ncbi:hypothetical protein [Archangium lipolyticum]|uniref:hypothetical protein n=1 Tax=Archangium lipolyticum TaxID=2970465 RepID=UPI002149BA5F|nr:hypothetical protein [Archangium lipolyticum]
MMPPFPAALVRTALVSLLLASGRTATAAEWNGAEPGITRTQELLQRFGKPARRSQKGGQLLLDYRGRTLPRDTRGVRFHVDPERELLQRIEVFPRKPPTRAELEETFGPACVDEARSEAPCYQVRATPDNQLSFHYPTLGVEVIFQRGRVRTLVYQPVDAQPRSVEASAPPAPEPTAEPAPAAPAEPLPTASPSSEDEDLGLKRPTVVTDASTLDTGLPPRPAEVTPSAEPEPTALPGRVTITDVEAPAAREEQGSRPHDILSLGGIYYQRVELSGTRQSRVTTLQPTLPSLVDLFVDVKPSESVRSFVRGRLLFDPLDPAYSKPQVLLDQLWIKFALADRVFITAGRQQLKWGSSRVWNPTDFLRQPNPLPLDVFDLRTGVDMLKVNVPWEALASNLWLVATADLNGPESQRLRYGGAVRAEVTLGTSELSATAAVQQGRRPRYGLDWNVGVGLFDFNAEVALVRDSPFQRWERTGEGFTPRPVDGPKVLASVGAQSTFRFAQVFRAVLRLEGFYNQLGYDDRSLLTWLRSTGDYQALYFGRYYLMGQFSLERRSAIEPAMFLTLLANVRDASFLPRLDVALLPLREVYVSAFIEAPFGQRGGEFRFEPDPSVAELPITGRSLLRAGLSVRIRM